MDNFGQREDNQINARNEERKQTLFTQTVSLDTKDFMNFSHYFLGMSISILMSYYQNGQLDEEAKYSQLQDGYKKDRQGFLQKFSRDFGNLLRGVQRGSDPPDELPADLAYSFLDKHRINWLEFLRQKIKLELSNQEVQRCRKILRRHQKFEILEYWWRKQENEGPETIDRLQHLLEQYKNEASQFEESSVLISDQQVGTSTFVQAAMRE